MNVLLNSIYITIPLSIQWLLSTSEDNPFNKSIYIILIKNLSITKSLLKISVAFLFCYIKNDLVTIQDHSFTIILCSCLNFNYHFHLSFPFILHIVYDFLISSELSSQYAIHSYNDMTNK